ncbi:MAG: phosphopentomutase [Candidatus Dormibacteria bacterium]
MARAILLVIDGLGVGAMHDAGAIRPSDTKANSLLHVSMAAEHSGRGLELPHLYELGLHAACPELAPGPLAIRGAAAGRTALGYPGADTYLGHQTMFGADLEAIELRVFATVAADVAAALQRDGHRIEAIAGSAFLVDGAMVVGDSLEADPGLNYNVTGSLDLTSFEAILAVSQRVRELTTVARVIAVGGKGLTAADLGACVRTADGGVTGIDTPQTGFYRRPGLRVVHIPPPGSTSRLLPNLCIDSGLPVTLIGKVAEVVRCDGATAIPSVSTSEVFSLLATALAEQSTGLIAVNVQEADLAGHQQDPDVYAEILREVDAALGTTLRVLSANDTLIVTGDHGNDPTIGHPFHTREYVPFLVWSPASARPFTPWADRRTLADVGAALKSVLELPSELPQSSNSADPRRPLGPN